MKKGKSRGRILLTGPRGSLGSLVLELLLQQDLERLVIFDVMKPKGLPPEVIFYKIDLTKPVIDERIARILEREEIDTVIHAAILWNPVRDRVYAHEVDVIGSLHVLNACHQQEIPKLIVLSSTVVYGAKSTNPNYLSEEHPLYQGYSNGYVRDKVEVETEIRKFRQRHPKSTVTVLRPCMIIGPKIQNFIAKVFSQPVVPTVLGYDPLVQFVHEDDVLRAVELALENDYHGEYNIVGEGILPLSYAIKLAGKINIPFLYSIARPSAALLWQLNLWSFPPYLLDYMRYLWVADGVKAEKEMGFAPKYSSREALESYFGEERLRRIHLSDTQGAA